LPARGRAENFSVSDETGADSELVLMLDEGNVHSYRQFFLDGRGHTKDLGPLWMGDSVAKWDGDALVVDTVGFNDKTWLNGQGLPHSDQLHVIERFQRPDLGHLSVDITMDDPKAFTKPHTFNRTYDLLNRLGDSRIRLQRVQYRCGASGR
jgi:hypothetical protein